MDEKQNPESMRTEERGFEGYSIVRDLRAGGATIGLSGCYGCGAAILIDPQSVRDQYGAESDHWDPFTAHSHVCPGNPAVIIEDVETQAVANKTPATEPRPIKDTPQA